MESDSDAQETADRSSKAIASSAEADVTPLLQSTEGSLALMHRALAESADSTLRTSIARLAKSENNPFVSGLFEHWLAPDERKETLGTDIKPSDILELEGDPLHGEELFFGSTQCYTCHQLNGQGRPFGPDLKLTATRYDREALLDQIL